MMSLAESSAPEKQLEAREQGMKSRDIKLKQSQKEELDALAALPDDQIDTSDIPEGLEGSNSVRGLFHKSDSERSKAIDKLRGRRSPVTDTSEHR